MSEEGKHSGKRVSDSGVKEPKSCQAILQSGKRKGLPCGAPAKPNSLFCGRSGHAPSKSKIVCSYISDETGDQCTYLTVGEGRYCDLHKNFCNVVIEEEEEEEEENTTSPLTSPHVHSDPPGSRDLAISSEDMVQVLRRGRNHRRMWWDRGLKRGLKPRVLSSQSHLRLWTGISHLRQH